MRGVSLMAVKELLGHESIEMTLRYSHLSPDVKRDAVRMLDAPKPRVSGNLTATEPALRGPERRTPGTQRVTGGKMEREKGFELMKCT
jgi:hypothetical protein